MMMPMVITVILFILSAYILGLQLMTFIAIMRGDEEQYESGKIVIKLVIIPIIVQCEIILTYIILNQWWR